VTGGKRAGRQAEAAMAGAGRCRQAGEVVQQAVVHPTKVAGRQAAARE